LVQASDANLPALLELCEQSRGTTHRVGVAGDTLGAAILPLDHQPGTRQYRHMFLHGGKGHVVVRSEFAHGRVGVHDTRQDVAACGIGERAEQLIQGARSGVSIYNHLVVDNSTARWSAHWAEEFLVSANATSAVSSPVPVASAIIWRPDAVR
jgi:hypothetical protein